MPTLCICFFSYQIPDDPKSQPSSDPQPIPAARRQTMASAQRPDRSNNTAKEEESVDLDRPKLHPPDIMTDSLYASVKKTKKNTQFPAPNMPAPPPPYDGKAMKNKPKTMPSQEKPERNTSPDYISVAGGAMATPDVAPHPPPTRPYRPPAGKFGLE